jgi:MFS family permease
MERNGSFLKFTLWRSAPRFGHQVDPLDGPRSRQRLTQANTVIFGNGYSQRKLQERMELNQASTQSTSPGGGQRVKPLVRRPSPVCYFVARSTGSTSSWLTFGAGGVFLLTQAHWNQATIGGLLTMSGLIGITAHTPIGALIDATHHKRGLIIVGSCALAVSALAIGWSPTMPVVLTADILMAIAGAIFAPTVAAITLGTIGQQGLAARLGRNAAFDRAGNIFIAVLAGLVGWGFSQRAVFFLVPIFAVFTILAVQSIPADSIDHNRARGLDDSDGATDPKKPAVWRVLLERRPLLVLAAANALFHFANAPMLPLLGQKLALHGCLRLLGSPLHL